MTVLNRQFIEKSLPDQQKSLKAEFVEKKFIAATVDQEELVPSRFKARIGNVHIPDPAVEVSGGNPCTIKITDTQGVWLFNYPR